MTDAIRLAVEHRSSLRRGGGDAPGGSEGEQAADSSGHGPPGALQQSLGARRAALAAEYDALGTVHRLRGSALR